MPSAAKVQAMHLLTSGLDVALAPEPNASNFMVNKIVSTFWNLRKTFEYLVLCFSLHREQPCALSINCFYFRSKETKQEKNNSCLHKKHVCVSTWVCCIYSASENHSCPFRRQTALKWQGAGQGKQCHNSFLATDIVHRMISLAVA